MDENELLKDRLSKAPEWQLKKYKELLRKVNIEKLSTQNHRYLLWLAGLDEETIKNMLEIGKYSK
ncbi:hypothetical protein ABS337_002916 [Listeria monocytogenes]|uniref:hypothetical protein n=1 Tax=Vagococcus sp. TaxID=1933889 RepID=UPI0010D3E0B3|nr:hypothetical protein [Listeria monocytogenes]EAE7595892.1 hypothetical protein [Listeria monocytogenes]EAE7639659.1 hypothetical protein [Listeria monocytogenes]EAH0053118.1 hypothetical protein [Listeria monocytogenes]EAH0434140.1 hypothetical protein [Listeria monocytogenes]